MKKIYFHDNLRYLVEMRGTTFYKESRAMGFGGNTLAEYCNNKRFPTVYYLVRIAEHFGISLDDLDFKDLEHEY